jgi:Gnt-I system high-affinity gluconate transporter
MTLLCVLTGIVILLVLILKKMNPMIALLIVAVVTGLLLRMPFPKIMASISSGIGNTLGGILMILALGAMIGKLAEDSGAAKKIVQLLIRLFGVQNIQWATLFTGIVVGIPLFYNAGFIVLIPLIFSIAAETGLPRLYVGMPMIAALSITHGFLPPHPGPVALASVFHADIGIVLFYGMLISLPAALIAGIVFPRLILKLAMTAPVEPQQVTGAGSSLPSAFKSLTLTLMPVLLIAIGNAGTLLFKADLKYYFSFFADPTLALLISLLTILVFLPIGMKKAMESCAEGVKSVAMILLIIAAGGAFKQVLIDSGVGEIVKGMAATWSIPPLLLGWALAAMLRITLGSATVAALTTAGLVMPFIHSGTSPELMVLSVGAGSLMLSHVNDTGFWMFKEYFGLTIRETFKTWTFMECIISILGLSGVLIINIVHRHF